MKKIKFNAKVVLGKGLNPLDVPFELETKTDEREFFWDDVYEGGYDAAGKIYPEEDFPNMDVVGLEIKTDEGIFPVVSEDCTKEEINKLGAKKALVLNYARYSLSPEYKTFLNLVEKGLLPEDAEFDIETMQEILNTAKESLK